MVRSDVVRAVQERYHIAPKEEVDFDRFYQQLDSVEKVNLVSLLEKKLALKLSEDEFHSIRSYADLGRLIEKKR